MQSNEGGSTDPRLHDAYVERHPGADGDVVLVGALHDHPASKYRVRTIVERERPAVLALELPPLTLPLYEHYAADDGTPPLFGGEMSAAIQAATTDHVAGIDGPTPAFLRRVLARLYRERASFETVRDTAKRFLSVSKKAVTARLAATLATLTTVQVAVDAPTAYGTGWRDDPADQADDERERVRTANAMLSAFEPPPAAAIQTTARERHMAERLRALRRHGDVVAVVGIAHLDGVAAHLAERQ
ncbi:TraB/GumN family protein [Haloarcula marina]|uniref:TraB/GumN family protein n=1 Tax=Haloarcula marina TaxID=2961574 RepID=UPI0020B6FF28|nr:TraB/GumN family protein [Halomicroarcula marina]